MAFTRECLLCHKKYQFCYCDNEPNWKVMFCDENCFEVFNLMQKHSIGELSDQEAIEELEKHDLTVVKNSTEAIQNQLKRILDKKVVEEVVETDIEKPAEETEPKKDFVPIQPKRKRKVTNKNNDN